MLAKVLTLLLGCKKVVRMATADMGAGVPDRRTAASQTSTVSGPELIRMYDIPLLIESAHV